METPLNSSCPHPRLFHPFEWDNPMPFITTSCSFVNSPPPDKPASQRCPQSINTVYLPNDKEHLDSIKLSVLTLSCEQFTLLNQTILNYSPHPINQCLTINPRLHTEAIPSMSHFFRAEFPPRVLYICSIAFNHTISRKEIEYDRAEWGTRINFWLCSFEDKNNILLLAALGGMLTGDV